MGQDSRNETVVDMGDLTVTKTSEVGQVFLDFWFGGVRVGVVEIIESVELNTRLLDATWYPEVKVRGKRKGLKRVHLFTAEFVGEGV